MNMPPGIFLPMATSSSVEDALYHRTCSGCSTGWGRGVDEIRPQWMGLEGGVGGGWGTASRKDKPAGQSLTVT
jgi:hypothetical protein